jgi:electron transfer flavoprotein alpha subunit
MSDVWILSEQFNGHIETVAFELLNRAADLAAKKKSRMCAVQIGPELSDAELNRLIECGADVVFAVESAELADFNPEPYAACLQDLIEKYKPEIIIAAATTTGRTVMPYAAMSAHAGLTADCTELDIEPDTGLLLQTRPAIGGNIMATIKTPECRPQMATVRPHSGRPATPQPGRTGEIIRITPGPELLKSKTKVVGFEPVTDELLLQDAEKVVIVGRGIKRPENLPLVHELCEALGAALGATRDVVDRGWLSYPHQVGLSGKTINPKLCVSVGVSGAIQQLAGMQTADNIIAVNSDPEAQIFKVADIGIVGDLFEVIPALIEKIKNGEIPC